MTGVSIEDVKRWEKVFAEERGFHPRSREKAEQIIEIVCPICRRSWESSLGHTEIKITKI